MNCRSAALVKGGHLGSHTVSDLLLARGRDPLWLRHPRIATVNTHGTGCTLSSAIAAWLALGCDLTSAVRQVHAYLRGALAAGAGVAHGAAAPA